MTHHESRSYQGQERGRETCARYWEFVRPYEYSEFTFAAMKIRLPRSYGGSTCSALQRDVDDNDVDDSDVDDDKDDADDDDDEHVPCTSMSSSLVLPSCAMLCITDRLIVIVSVRHFELDVSRLYWTMIRQCSLTMYRMIKPRFIRMCVDIQVISCSNGFLIKG